MFFCFKGKSISAFIDNKETEDIHSAVFHPTKVSFPSVSHQYAVCIYDNLKIIKFFIEIDWNKIEELIQLANARRKSAV